MSTNSQKFIARNRAPRVQIEYDVETNGAQKKVNLPFIVGVMADLAGKSDSPEAKKLVADRKFLEIDVDNFDKRMSALKPKLSFQAENMLTGEGTMPVSIEFESMEDFSPAKVAAKVDSLKKMMEARNQLSALLTYMDGKTGAEELLAKVMGSPDLMKSIAELPKSQEVLK
jgi:type VI secretion system protein ImpB